MPTELMSYFIPSSNVTEADLSTKPSGSVEPTAVERPDVAVNDQFVNDQGAANKAAAERYGLGEISNHVILGKDRSYSDFALEIRSRLAKGA